MSDTPVDTRRMTDTFGEDYAFLNEIYTAFMEDMAVRLTALGAHIEAVDAENCFQIAHAIKGSSANVGADNIREMASSFEKSAHAGDLSSGRDTLVALTEEFERVKRFLHEYLDSIKS